MPCAKALSNKILTDLIWQLQRQTTNFSGYTIFCTTTDACLSINMLSIIYNIYEMELMGEAIDYCAGLQYLICALYSSAHT